MKKHCSISIFNDLSVFLQCIDAKINEFALIIEEYGCRGFLVIASVAGIKNLDADFSILVWMSWSDSVSELRCLYPEAPVPKSMAMTCVKELSSLSNAMLIQIITVTKLIR